MIFVCLGNPGEKHSQTRHNAGVIFGQWLKKKNISGKIVLSPFYMNQSGKAVGGLGAKDLERLFLVHDDLDIPFGEFKIQFGRGSAGHKGIESVISSLGTDQFWRVRIGIGRPPEGVLPEDFVLTPFSEKEKKEFSRIFSRIWQKLEAGVYLSKG